VDREALLVHQTHPAKVAIDLSAAAISSLLLWRRQLLAGALVRYLLPAAGSVAVLSLVDLSRHRLRPAGRYALDHLTPGAQAIRLGGDLVMALGAWRRQPWLIAAGAGLVLAGWSHGLLPRARSEPGGQRRSA
jgi:hypothetical protein